MPTTVTGAAIINPTEVALPSPLVSPSLQPPEQQEPLPGPIPQRTHNGSPSIPAPQSQQTPPAASGQCPSDHPPPLHLITAPQPEDMDTRQPPSPCSDLSGPGATDPIPPAAPPTAAPSTSEPDSPEHAPPPVRAFAFTGTSLFITPVTIQYLQTIPANQRWSEMVTSYLRFEELPPTKDVRIYRF